jgi:hypothetical protein
MQYSSSGWSSPAGYLPELGINFSVWVNNSSGAGPRVCCRVGFEPGAAVQQTSALNNLFFSHAQTCTCTVKKVSDLIIPDQVEFG